MKTEQKIEMILTYKIPVDKPQVHSWKFWLGLWQKQTSSNIESDNDDLELLLQKSDLTALIPKHHSITWFN